MSEPSPPPLSRQVDVDPGVPFHELTVARVIDETPDARSFVLEIPTELGSTFEYVAGQFLTFRVPWEDFHVSRCYSLASCPERDEPPKVTVKRVDGGRVSNWFNDRLAAGDRIAVRPPAGAFVLHEAGRPLVLFAGGSGITPIISLLKTALHTTSRRVRLLYANRDARSIIFRGELDALAAEHGERLEVRHHLDDEGGFLSAAQIGAWVGAELDADFYICGPGPYMDAVESALGERGVDRGRIRIERFVSAVDPDRRPEPGPESAQAPAAGAAPASFRLTSTSRRTRCPTPRARRCSNAPRAPASTPPSPARRATAPAAWPSCAAARWRWP